jgi:hypothetical protein
MIALNYYTTGIMTIRDPIETDHIIQVITSYINNINSHEDTYEDIDIYDFFSYDKKKFDKIKIGDILALCQTIGSSKFYYYKKVTKIVSLHTITKAINYVHQIKDNGWVPLLVESHIFDPMYVIIHFERTNLFQHI